LEDIEDFDFQDSNNQNTSQFLAKKLRPAFDVLWQACGYPKSLYFNADGVWNPTH
jgi:hypothetical protein